jgi:hypothetical protein
MPGETLSRATDNIKSKLLPQRGLKRRLRSEVEACFDYFDKPNHGGPISALHVNGLTLEKLKGEKVYRVEFEVFYAPGHKDSLVLKGRKVTMQRVSSAGISARQFLPRAEVDGIISKIQHATVPYREKVESRRERREKVKNLLTRLTGRLPARFGGGTSGKAEY